MLTPALASCLSCLAASRDILGHTSSHVHILPHPALRRSIAHYSLSFPGAEGVPATLRLVPDASGCIVCARRAGGVDTPCFWGPTSRWVEVLNDVNSTPLRVFIEFRPCGAHELLRGLPLARVRDTRLPLRSLDALLDGALRIVVESSPIPTLPDRLDALFLARLNGISASPLMETLIHHMTRSGGTIRVADLVRHTRYSERHLRRVCAESLGLNLKSFARVVRINQACTLLREGPSSLTVLAQILGYYDQAHFIHDFRMVCGVSPSGYMRNTAVFYKEEFK